MAVDYIGTGWAYPLDVSPNGSFAMASGVHKLEQAMRLILSTYPGERPMRPDFGCRLRDFVFRGATLENAADVAYEVRTALNRWEPRADVEEVDVYPDIDDIGMLYIDIRYRVKATNDWRNLVFPFYTIPENEDER